MLPKSATTFSNTYAYLPYGDTANGMLNGTSWGYAGYRYDAETGTYHTGARSYDPRLGRFVQADPIGQDGGTNIYAYADGNPLNATDPSGLNWVNDVGSYEAGYNNSMGGGACGCEGNPEHEAAQNAFNDRVAAAGDSPSKQYGRGEISYDQMQTALGLPTSAETALLAQVPTFNPESVQIPLAYPGSATTQLACGAVCAGAAAGSFIEPGFGTAIGAGIGLGITVLGGWYIVHSENGDTQATPPSGSRPIDQSPWSGDHQDIKAGIGAGPRDRTSISPAGDVWGQNADGTWTNYGPAGNFTESGNPSGRRGKDRSR